MAETADESTGAHTPGEWKLLYDGSDIGEFVLLMGSALEEPTYTWKPPHKIVLYDEVYDKDAEYAECEANTRLITAAPKLLAALREIKHLTDFASTARSIKEIASAAIAKATKQENDNG